MATSTTTSTTTAAVTTKDMKSKQLYLSMPRIPPKVYLKTVNPHITCRLCNGYLIDATTIVECLHSFCRSCIMMHLRTETYCPCCEMLINKVKPNIKRDATLQAIVYKLVPGLYGKERHRRREFYKKRTKEALEATPEQRGDDTEHLIFEPKEKISLMLVYSDNDNLHHNSDDESSNSSHEINSSEHCDDDFEVQLRKPKYLSCPAIFTIFYLKKFLLYKFNINPNKFCVEIMYKVKSLALADHYTLMDVAYIFTWKRDAPMKLLYCVRAAHSPVANIEQSAVMYDLPSNHFQTNTQLVCASDSTDPEQDQSSDADSESRSDRAKETEVNGSDAQTSQDDPINSTSDEPSAPSSSSSFPTTQSTIKAATSSATVTSTSIAGTSSTPKIKSETETHTSVNGSESQKKEASDNVRNESTTTTSPTTSSRSETIVAATTTTIKTERLSMSPEKQPLPDRKSNGSSPKPNTSKSRSTPDMKPNVSPSRTNQDLKDSKEKVKTKSSITDSSVAKSNDSPSNRCAEPKTVTFSDKPAPSSVRPSASAAIETKTTPMPATPIADRSKGRLIFNKDEKTTSLSPPLSAENEYDFDQHLLKEKLSEKKKFLSSIHLTPRIPSTDSPLVQLPKMPKMEQQQKSETTTTTAAAAASTTSTTTATAAATATHPTNSSKDKDSSKLPTTNSTTPVRPSVSSSLSSSSNCGSNSNTTSTSTTTTGSNSSNSKSSSGSTSGIVATSTSGMSISGSSSSSILDRLAGIKRPENKASKRKSREPVKNVAKVKCVSPDDRTVDLKWKSMLAPSLAMTSMPSLSNPSSSANSNIGDRPRKPANDPSRLLGAVIQLNNHSKSNASSGSSSTNKLNQASTGGASASAALKSVFKTPTPSSSKEPTSQSTGLKQQSQPSTSESETSIIINNVQRPTQADTPRPPMSFKPSSSQQSPFFFTPNLNRSFLNETEIQEIRNDDAGKLKVYGPAMRDNMHKSYEMSMNTPTELLMHNLFAAQLKQTQMPFGLNQLVAMQQMNSLEVLKNIKTKKLAAAPKKPCTSDLLQNTLIPMRFAEQTAEPAKSQNVSMIFPQNLYSSCKIPPSLSITLTNDDTETVSRSIFSTKNSNVVNSIEIVKLPDESGPESIAKFSTPAPLSLSPALSSSSSSGSSSGSGGDKNAWQINKSVNNQLKLLTQQNNQIDSTLPISQHALSPYSETYQAKFLQSLLENKTSEASKNPKKLIKPSTQPIRPNLNMSAEELARKREAQKRRQQIEEKAAKMRKLQPATMSSSTQPTQTQTQKLSSVTQRPVPDLLIPKDDKKASTTLTNSSGGSSSTQTTPIGSTKQLANNSKSQDRQSPTVSSNNSSSDKTTANVTVAVAQAKMQSTATNEIPTSKYLPLQTSSMPIWANHCTPDHQASHKALVENLTQSKKNSGTLID